MRTNLKYVWMLAAALVLGVTSCNKDDDGGPEDGGVVAGLDTYVTVNVTAPVTYAVNPANGTTAESAFTNVDVFIYDSNNNLSTSTRLSGFTLNAGVWEAPTTVAAKTGDSKIYIAVNLDDATRTALLAGTITALDVERTVTQATIATDNKFIMTTTDFITRTLEAYDPLTDPIPTANEIKATVTRLASKVTVEKGTALTFNNIDGGQIDATNFQFGVGQLNTLALYRQATPGVGANHTKTFTPGQEADGLTNIPGSYINVNNAGVGIPNDYQALAALYVPENTNDKTGGVPRAGNLTYIAVKAQFYPDDEATWDGTDLVVTGNQISNIGENFYVVKVNDDEASSPTFGETLNLYFYDQTQAAAFVTAGGYTGAGVDYSVAVTEEVEYLNSLCYYTVYMNMADDYDVYRNDFYRSTITKITGLGDPAPGPKDPDVPPVDKRTDIEISIEVEPWNLVSQYDEIGPQ